MFNKIKEAIKKAKMKKILKITNKRIYEAEVREPLNYDILQKIIDTNGKFQIDITFSNGFKMKITPFEQEEAKNKYRDILDY